MMAREAAQDPTEAPQEPRVSTLDLALVTDVFPDFDQPGGRQCLRDYLAAARARGARLVVLPELPLNAWSPAGRDVRSEDAEPPEGPRHRALATAAIEARVAILGGAIVIDEESGERRNRSLLIDAKGNLVARYDKVHLPSEEGYWESDHYAPGRSIARPFSFGGFTAGVQICSDNMRPVGCHLLAASGAEVVFAPRATPLATYPRWRGVLYANAVTSCAYVISANRPRPESGVDIGGASLAIAPDGEILAETSEPLAMVRIESRRVTAARVDYPGYLATYPELYGDAWCRLSAA